MGISRVVLGAVTIVAVSGETSSRSARRRLAVPSSGSAEQEQWRCDAHWYEQDFKAHVAPYKPGVPDKLFTTQHKNWDKWSEAKRERYTWSSKMTAWSWDAPKGSLNKFKTWFNGRSKGRPASFNAKRWKHGWDGWQEIPEQPDSSGTTPEEESKGHGIAIVVVALLLAGVAVAVYCIWFKKPRSDPEYC